MLYIVIVLIGLGVINGLLKLAPKLALILIASMGFLMVIAWFDTASCSNPLGTNVGDPSLRLGEGRIARWTRSGRHSESRFDESSFLSKYEKTDWNKIFEEYGEDFVKFTFMDIVEQHCHPEDEIFKLRGWGGNFDHLETEYPKALKHAESKVGHKLTLHKVW